MQHMVENELWMGGKEGTELEKFRRKELKFLPHKNKMKGS